MAPTLSVPSQPRNASWTMHKCVQLRLVEPAVAASFCTAVGEPRPGVVFFV